jgi:hypothetical protein
MPRTLVVPGVSVETRFDVPPPLPARSGILGAVGIVDIIPEEKVKSVTSTQELFDLYGPATRYSFPEAVSALVNGVSEVVVSPVNPSGGQNAEVVLLDDEGDAVVKLRARAAGPWGNDLAVRVIRAIASDRRTVRRVTLEVLFKGIVVDRHENLILDPSSDYDLFNVINSKSALIFAIDPLFETDLPVLDAGLVQLASQTAAAAQGALKMGAADLIRVAAKNTGVHGNKISLATKAGRAIVMLKDSTDKDSILIRAAEPGSGGTNISIGVADNGAGKINITVQQTGFASRVYSNLGSVTKAVTELNKDPAILAEKKGNLLPKPMDTPVSLATTVTVTVVEEGVRTVDYFDMPSADELTKAINSDPSLTATLAGAATDLPDIDGSNDFYLTGGRDAGFVRDYMGQNNPASAILELRPKEGVDAAKIRLRMQAGSEAGTVKLVIGLQLDTGYQEQESHNNLTMDPDSMRYLPKLLAAESDLLAGLDLYVREHASNWPAQTASPRALANGSMPPASAWQDAIDALAREDVVDMLLAGLQEWADTDLNGIAVQQMMLGHSLSQADNAKPRIVIGSIAPNENADIGKILDHAGQVANRRFVLVAPSGAEGAIAGLLGHLEYFQSPTFKTIAQAGVPLAPYSEGELNKLVGPEGNICIITKRRGRGTICVKGIATDGFQISVVRVADRCVREVKQIADRFIGELNNSDSRSALKQMIVATFTQMERDGALVPSVDGSSPAFQVEVYASQNDVAAGNARIDIAVRPVRAIDYIYATIRVRN